MLTDTKKMLDKARDGGYAVGAFNAENAEMVFAIVAAAQKCKAPVILQTTPSTLRYLPPACFAGIAAAAAKNAAVPVALHLDHGDSLELVKECLDAGYTSVMFDGSRLPFAENADLTAQAVQMAKACGASCEGELGTVGGKEDSLTAEAGAYTDPAEAAEFVRCSGVDSLAVAVGTAHGVYHTAPKLDLARIPLIQAQADLPLVLHGASGLPDTVVREAVAKGMAKVNFATELRQTFTEAVRRALAQEPQGFDPKKYLDQGRKSVQKLVEQKIQVCGAAGQT